MLQDLIFRLRSLFRRTAVEADLDEELRCHLEFEAEKYTQSGLSRDEALRRARLAFGTNDEIQEQCRDAWGTRAFEDVLRDFRYAFRLLSKSPGFASTVILTLAAGIGASTAIFSVANALLLRPLPYRAPDRLVFVSREFRKSESGGVLFSDADFLDLRNSSGDLFEELAGVYSFRAFVPRENGSTEQITKAQVTPGFFRLLGIRMAAGRDFTTADGLPQPGPQAIAPIGSSAILSYEYWRQRYGGDPGVIGREMLTASGRGPRIVGVLTPGFELLLPERAGVPRQPEVWIASNLVYDPGRRDLVTLRVIGRLRPGIALAEARNRADIAATQVGKRLGADDLAFRLELLHPALVAPVRPAILALMVAATFLLLIVCANVTNLFLVRISGRERELAVRLALGGSRWRVVRQTLAEAMLLAAPGILAGLGLAWAGIRELLSIAPADLPRLHSVSIDWHVCIFAAAAGLLPAILSGTIPALRTARRDLPVSLRTAGHTAGVGTRRTLRDAVVVTEVSLSFILLIGSGLLFRSFLELRRIDPGYDPHGVLTFALAREWKFDTPSAVRTSRLAEVQRRLRSIPGVENAAASNFFPLASPAVATPWGTTAAAVEAADARTADFQTVLPGYLEALHSRLIAGRTFTDDDNRGGRPVAVIDEAFAARAFPHSSALGRRIYLPLPEAPSVEIIGIVAHQRQASLAEPGLEQIYVPDGLAGFGIGRHWAVRTSGDPAKLAGAIRAAIAQADPQWAISKMQPMQALVAQAEAPARFALTLVTLFAAVSLLLAGIGLYGVLAAVVRHRTAEIGLRLALGATPAGVFGMLARRGLALSAAGTAIGLVAALALTRGMSSLLVGIRASDPVTYAGVVLLFFSIAALACWVPAHRAAALDPAAILRAE